MSNGFSVASKVSLRLGKGLNLKLLVYARPALANKKKRPIAALSLTDLRCGSRILREMQVSTLSFGFKAPRIGLRGSWVRGGRESDVASLAPFRFD